MNNHSKRFGLVLCIGFLFTGSAARGQIPASGSDVQSLSRVQWGMSVEEVKERIGKRVEEMTDTSLSFPDSFLNSNVHATLKFGKADSNKGLRFIDIQFDDKDVEKLRSYLTTRYGKSYETEKKEKTKLFFTVNFEASKWLLKNESIVMMVFSHSGEVLGLSVLYNGKGR
jgi:hypothetical protein